jgi:hypothetical protein
MWEIPRDTVWKCNIHAAAFVEWLHVGFMCFTGVLSVALAYIAKTTQWALITLLCALITGIIVRTVYWARLGGKVDPDSQQPPAVSGTLGFPSGQPSNDQPSALPATAAAAATGPPTGIRFNLEPMHGYYPMHARPPAKSKGQ